MKPKYMPKKVTLQQYYHLRQEDVEAILKHWTLRQAAGKALFRFRKTVLQKEHTLHGNDSDANMGPNEEEADPEDHNASQTQEDGPPQQGGSSEGSEQPPGQSLGNAGENLTMVSRLLKQGRVGTKPPLSCSPHIALLVIRLSSSTKSIPPLSHTLHPAPSLHPTLSLHATLSLHLVLSLRPTLSLLPLLSLLPTLSLLPMLSLLPAVPLLSVPSLLPVMSLNPMLSLLPVSLLPLRFLRPTLSTILLLMARHHVEPTEYAMRMRGTVPALLARSPHPVTR